jgi:hypothetical protein
MIRRRDRKARCISTGADRLDPARIVLGWRAFIYYVSAMAFGLASTRSLLAVTKPNAQLDLLRIAS